MTTDNQLQPNEPTNKKSIDQYIMGRDTGYIQNTSNSPLIPPYYSKKRDNSLLNLAIKNDYLMIAFFNLITKVVSIKPKIKQEGTDEEYISVINDYLQSIWSQVMIPALFDLLTTDNGMFIELLSDNPETEKLEPSEISENVFIPALGMRHLSSHNCYRTGDPEYPVVYKDSKGKRTKLHHSRVYTLIDMDIGKPELNGVGFCALSRVLQTATKSQAIEDLLIDLLYDGLVGEIIIVYPLSSDNLAEAYKLAEKRVQTGKNKHEARYKRNVLIGSEEEPPMVERIPLRRLPDNYDEETAVRVIMALLASSIGIDARELFPASQIGATKADAEIQHAKSRVKFVRWWLGEMKSFLTNLFIPDGAIAEFSYIDEAEEAAKAKKRDEFSQTAERELNAGILSRSTILENYMDKGYISEEQYERELLTQPIQPTNPDLFTQ